MMDELTPDADHAAYEEAARRIREHPRWIEHLELLALERSIVAVFVPNFRELVHLLDDAATNEDLAIELIQNVREPIVRDRFHFAVTRRLHNYLASSESLAEHARRLMREPAGAIADEYDDRRAALVQNPEDPFMKGLRNFTLHRRLPFFGHTLRMTGANTPEQRMESEVELGVSELLEWDGWKAPTRVYLEGWGNAVALRPVVKKHGTLVLKLNGWLHDELVRANDPALQEVNELIVAANMILSGGDRERAERMSDLSTRSDPEWGGPVGAVGDA